MHGAKSVVYRLHKINDNMMKRQTRISGVYEAPQCEVTLISLEGCLLASKVTFPTPAIDQMYVEDEDEKWF